MKIIKTLGSLALVLGIASNAYAAEGDTYGGLQYSMLSYSEIDLPDYELTALIGRYGQFISDEFAMEVRMGYGLADDTQKIFGIDAILDLDTFLGVYGVGYSYVSPASRLYWVVGLTQSRLTVTIPEYRSDSKTDADISYGLGVDIELGDSGVINLEYMNYMEFENSADITAIAIGYKAYF